MSARNIFGVQMDPFQHGLVRARHAQTFIGDLQMEFHQARESFIDGGAEWLWTHHREHVRALPPDLQLALIDDARLVNKVLANEMVMELFPGSCSAGGVAGL